VAFHRSRSANPPRPQRASATRSREGSLATQVETAGALKRTGGVTRVGDGGAAQYLFCKIEDVAEVGQAAWRRDGRFILR
jgi:hypothetical protein